MVVVFSIITLVAIEVEKLKISNQPSWNFTNEIPWLWSSPQMWKAVT